MRLRVWKLLDKGVHKSPSHGLRFAERILSCPCIAPTIHVKSRKFSSSCRCLPCIFIFGNIWIIIRIYHPPRCLIVPPWGQLCAHSRSWIGFILSLITIINHQVFSNCNQPSGTYRSLTLGICKVQVPCAMMLHGRKVASCLRDKIKSPDHVTLGSLLSQPQEILQGVWQDPGKVCR